MEFESTEQFENYLEQKAIEAQHEKGRQLRPRRFWNSTIFNVFVAECAHWFLMPVLALILFVFVLIGSEEARAWTFEAIGWIWNAMMQ